MAWSFPWGKYRATPPMLSDGTSAQPNLDANGNLKISEGVKITAESLGAGGAGIIGWLSEIAKRVTNSAVAAISTPQAKSISFDSDFTSFLTSPTAYMWKTFRAWTVPGPNNAHIFIPMTFYFQSQGTVSGRLVEKLLLGTSQNGTPFTDGSASIDPTHENWPYVEVEVITPVNANCTFTITYTNQLEQTGRTATVAVTTTMPAGHRLRVALQGTDQGIVDITNITQSVGITAGKIEVYGIKVFTVLSSADTNQTHLDQAPTSLQGAAMRATRVMAIEIASPDVSTSRTMLGGFIGNLQNEP